MEPIPTDSIEITSDRALNHFFTNNNRVLTAISHGSSRQGSAIIGKPYAKAQGRVTKNAIINAYPSLNDYAIDELQRRLFEYDYTSVSGQVKELNRHKLGKQIEKDFGNSNYNSRKIFELIHRNSRIKAGVVNIFDFDPDREHKTSNTVITPMDATENQRFGHYVAIDNGVVGVCDLQNNAYIYEERESDWKLVKILPISCNGISILNHKVFFGSTTAYISVVEKSEDTWNITGLIKPDELWAELEKINQFDRFGSSVAYFGDNLLVSNFGGGVLGAGEIYEYRKQNNKWIQSSIMRPPEGTRGYQRVPEGTRGYQRVPD